MRDAGSGVAVAVTAVVSRQAPPASRSGFAVGRRELRRRSMAKYLRTPLGLALLGAVAAILLLLAALPGGRPPGPCEPTALRFALPLQHWTSKLPRSAPPTPAAPAGSWARAFDVDRAAAADRLDLAARRLAIESPELGHLARSLVTLTSPAAEPAAPRPLPLARVGVRRLRAAAGLEEAIARISAENLAQFPPELETALATLIAVANRAATAVAAWRAASPVGASEASAALEALLRGDDVTLGVEFAAPAPLLDAAVEIADALDRVLPLLDRVRRDPALARLRPLPAGDSVPRGLIFASEGDAGLVLVGGLGATILPCAGAAIVVDLGGDDTWVDAAGVGDAPLGADPVRIAIDVDGRDHWRGAGGAVRGVTVLVDRRGDDKHEAERLGGAAAAFGFALVFDLEGDDRFAFDAAGGGFALAGAALLFDGGGDDTYRGSHRALAAAGPGGTAALVDLHGDDLYVTSVAGRGLELESTAGAARGGAQQGSFALLLDVAGRDSYRLGGRAGGSASRFAVAALLDVAGDDVYSALDRSLGFGEDRGLGLLRDFGGDDDYLARADSLGRGRDGIGMLIDDRGSDRFLALEPARGAATPAGAALFADAEPNGAPLGALR
jgi:hypothetical protein